MNRVEDFNRSVLLDGVTRLSYSPEIKVESEKKILEVAEFLEENREYNYVIYFNHISYNDPVIAIYIADKIDPKHRRRLFAPMTYSHIDPGRPAGKLLNDLTGLTKIFGVETMPVIQKYQVNNPEFGYTEEEARVTYTNLIRRLKELKETKTPTGVFISPEGHRSETGELKGAESGLTAIGRLLAPVVYVPVAISYSGRFGRDSINLGKKMRVEIGEVTAQEDPKEYPTVEELMNKLANALPWEMRGIWK